MSTAIDLFRELVATPDLPGAACVGERGIFDACTHRAAVPARAAAIVDLLWDRGRR